VAKLHNFLNLPGDHTELNLDLAISDLVRHELQHATRGWVRRVNPLSARCTGWHAGPTKTKRRASRRKRPPPSSQLHRAFQRDFEQQTAAVARLSALEGEAAALRERAGGAEAVQAAEVERLRAQDDVVPEIQAELARLTEALACAEREIWERGSDRDDADRAALLKRGPGAAPA
jgi:hypothetical protein